MNDSTTTGDPGSTLTVGELLSDPALELDLELLQGHEAISNRIRSPRLQNLGMALVGSSEEVHPDRVQVISGAEAGYLESLGAEDRLRAIERLEKYDICCIVVTQGVEIPGELLTLASGRRIPVIRSGAPGDVSIETIARYLERRLAPRITIHGGLLEIFGLGVVILGPSGIGKSECALDLVLKGHRLIADDYIEITRRGEQGLIGEGGKALPHHMELRGLGIIDIREMFGVSATGAAQAIDFIVRLERWRSDGAYDRLGLERAGVEWLGVSVPVIDLPVAPGRNIATLVEVAARIVLLQRGHKTNLVQV